MSHKILVVEDNDRNRRLLKILLKSNKYEVAEAASGEEAMNYLSKEKPDLILMDIQLPHIDGLELTKRIKDEPETKDIPIVAVTAYAMKGDRERILEAGCDDYISKPINTREVPGIIARTLQNNSDQ
ncbi:response regulator [Candidatus Poribacteria bacterium]|nr:response regulator [Candidatus Poribacteria bacterium]